MGVELSVFSLEAVDCVLESLPAVVCEKIHRRLFGCYCDEMIPQFNLAESDEGAIN